MKVHIVVITCLLCLTACSKEPSSIPYLCNDKPLLLNVIDDSSAELTFSNKKYMLMNEQSASGVKYINKEVLFWSKERSAMLIIAGKKYKCILK